MVASLVCAFLGLSPGTIKSDDLVYPKLKVEYVPFAGLKVMVDDVALVEGSGYQYYEKGWKQGYWSSAWKPVDIQKDRSGVITVYANSDDGRVANRQTFTPIENGFKCVAEFRWRGDKPAMLEYAVGRLWAPYLANGSLKLDGALVPMLSRPVKEGSTFEQRMFGSARKIAFSAPAANLNIDSTTPLVVLDGRNYGVEWAEGKELFWVGATDQEIKPQGTIRFEYTFQLEPAPEVSKNQETVPWTVQPLTAALGQNSQKFPLFPKPKSVQKSGGSLSVHNGLKFSAPAELDSEVEWFQRFMLGSWDWVPGSVDQQRSVSVLINPGITKSNGYQLNINGSGIEIIGQSFEGARYGIRTLAQLVEMAGGELTMPYISITDWPSAQWRGVHLFVGPTALQFQGKLMDRFLAPLKLNNVVLQCERTDWESTPGIETAITMKKADLRSLANRYRELGIEPTPLVQSMGHMEWFFANNKNRELAMNPQVPYTLDLRKAPARTFISSIWDEVKATVNPKIAHFGLDEIDNRGNEDKRLTDRLWQTGLPVLQDIAVKHGTHTMMWSDMLLYKGEAVDACHAPSLESAKMRRGMLKRGTYIADWHYKDDPNPETFDASLKLWNSMGMKPIAATWFRPKNIRGFTLSAIQNNAGILQTTWAGYESNEFNMVREFEQFSAMAIMAEYAWSGRTDNPNNLGYQPGALLQRLYFGRRQAIAPADGFAVGSSENVRKSIGSYSFLMSEPRQMYGVTSNESFRSPHSIVVPVNSSAKEVVLAMDCIARVNEVALTGQAIIHYTDGKRQSFDLHYGTHLRAISDDRPTVGTPRSGTVSAVRIPLEANNVARIEIVAANSAVGMRLHGVTLL